MLGLLDDLDQVVPSRFQEPGSTVLLIGETQDELGASEYLAVCHGLVAGQPPAIDLDEAKRLVDFLVSAASRRLLLSAHDCSDGGLAVALAECVIREHLPALGVEAALASEIPAAAALFGESQSRVVLSCAAAAVDDILELASRHGLRAAAIGTVGEPGGTFRLSAGSRTIEVDATHLAEVYESALPRRMEKEAGLTT
jgi:phosphoribosylformylglycinamidine synthase